MNKAQIEFLLNAGFSMEEIMNRFSHDSDSGSGSGSGSSSDSGSDSGSGSGSGSSSDSGSGSDPNSGSGSSSDSGSGSDPLPASMAAIEKAMNEIAAMLRTGALAAQFGPPDPERSVSDILAEVINPPRRNAK